MRLGAIGICVHKYYVSYYINPIMNPERLVGVILTYEIQKGSCLYFSSECQV